NHYACKEFPFAKSMFQNIEVAEFFEQRRLASLIQFDSEFSEFPQSVIAGAASKRRQKLAKDDSDLRRQMGVAEAARFLRITKSDLYTLMDHRLCHTLKEEELERHFLFDVAEVNTINALL